MSNILKWHKNKYLGVTKGKIDKNLYVIGESHSLTSHHLCIKNLGVNFKSQVECAIAAQKENKCKGDSIEWSEPYNMLWGCSCCEKGGSHPGHADDKWNTYCIKTEA